RKILALGLSLAGLVFLVGLAVRRRLSGLWRFRLLLLWVTGCVATCFWLPAGLRALVSWPAVAGIVLTLVWYLRSLVRRQPRSAPPSANRARQAPALTHPATTAVLALVLGLTVPGRAAAPGPETIFLVAGPTAAPDDFSALVRPELLDRLEKMARQGRTNLKGAVVLGAEYKGKIKGDVVRWNADFQVYCSRKSTELTLPLSRVVLQARGSLGEPGFFAGKPVYPQVLTGQQQGYRLPLEVAEPGVYSLQLRFTVRAGQMGQD